MTTQKYELNVNLEDMVEGYLKAALWTGDDGEGKPLDCRYDTDDILASSKGRAYHDCLAFLLRADQIVNGRQCEADCSQWGHDFWLTRNRHGCGFWDRPDTYYDQQTADELTELAHSFGERMVDVTSGGKVAVE